MNTSKHFKKVALLTASLLTVCSMRSSAGLVNGSFETGDSTGWTTTIGVATNYVEVPAPSPNGLPRYTNRISGVFSVGGVSMRTAVTNYVYNPNYQTNVYLPVGGNYLASIGVGYGVVRLRTQGDAPVPPKFDTSLSQTIQLNIGDRLSGWAYFYNGDYTAQDSMWVKVLDSMDAEIARPWFQISGGNVVGTQTPYPYQTTSPWTYWEWTAPNDGSYTLALGGTTMGDCDFNTIAYFDNIQITAAMQVPEPTSAAIFLSLSPILLALGRKRTARFSASRLIC